jgi:4'-phosphopantetheinyl transferase
VLWERPPATVGLQPGEVHVWSAVLGTPPRAVALCLSDDERGRAERFHSAALRDRFVAWRALLRTVLGRYLGLDPASLRFTYGQGGKPALASGTGVAPLRFNLSHSQERALYAVSADREVGIDIERVRPDVEYEEVARRFFSAGEVAALLALPPDRRVEAFFACWTRKEAFVKARGGGLQIPLDGFEVSLAPDEPAALLRVDGGPEERLRWTLRSLDAASGFAAALAVSGAATRVRGFEIVL